MECGSELNMSHCFMPFGRTIAIGMQTWMVGILKNHICESDEVLGGLSLFKTNNQTKYLLGNR